MSAIGRISLQSAVPVAYAEDDIVRVCLQPDRAASNGVLVVPDAGRFSPEAGGFNLNSGCSAAEGQARYAPVNGVIGVISARHRIIDQAGRIGFARVIDTEGKADKPCLIAIYPRVFFHECLLYRKANCIYLYHTPRTASREPDR